jgi:hypothetical protein
MQRTFLGRSLPLSPFRRTSLPAPARVVRRRATASFPQQVLLCNYCCDSFQPSYRGKKSLRRSEAIGASVESEKGSRRRGECSTSVRGKERTKSSGRRGRRTAEEREERSMEEEKERGREGRTREGRGEEEDERRKRKKRRTGVDGNSLDIAPPLPILSFSLLSLSLHSISHPYPTLHSPRLPSLHQTWPHHTQATSNSARRVLRRWLTMTRAVKRKRRSLWEDWRVTPTERCTVA